MKTEDEKLREIFNMNLEQQQGAIPDFQPMWEEAARGNRKIAASLVLLIAVGVFALLNRQNEVANSLPIASWNEPTKSLSLQGSEVIVLTKWTSPTDFLLPENNQHTK
jgi:hypothetical protein